MSFDSPAPGFVGPGVAEEAEEVKLGVADRTCTLFQLAQDLFEAHDRRSLYKPTLAEACTYQCVTQKPLRRVELLEGNPFALPGNEMPVKPLLVLERECCFGTLGRRQRADERLRCHAHHRGGIRTIAGRYL